MQKRGFTDQFDFGHFDSAPFGTNSTDREWSLIGAPTIRAGELPEGAGLAMAASVGEGHFAGSPVFDSDDGGSGPNPAAAGGKKSAGGGSTSGGGTTTNGGETTSGSGSGTTNPAPGQGTTTTVYHDVTTLWLMLNPPTGDASQPTDTYFYKEWNLTSATSGITVTKAWQNYTGSGIKVGIIDDGIDYNHSDLKAHYLYNLDYDATNGGSDAYGTSTDSHGTTVAGIIGAARDGTGTVGVAYNAGIAGFRISYSTGGSGQLADAFNHALSSGMDVVNASWGYTTAYADNFLSSGFASSKTAILNEAMSGRGGLGANIVFASGNGRTAGDNVNYHNFQNAPYVITVGGIDTTGHVASFSTGGAALLVSAPGGGYTDDRTGSAGYVSGDFVSASGTSYAAPAVAGVIALMLQANPNLGFRDVQEILAYSSKQIDPTNSSWHFNGAHNWNGGGLHFSEDYGFGLVNATAAVRLAESWQFQSTYANTSSESAVHVDNAVIPDGTGSLKSQIYFSSSLDVEKVVVDLNITHSNVSDLTITLTSPSGTVATLASHPSSGTGSGIVFETSANTFWGEDAKGTWTLTVTDSTGGNVGTLNNWSLTTLGDAPATPNTYVYTDDFATATGADRFVLNDASANATINTAAVTSGSYLDLHAGAIDTIAGRTLQIGATTIIKAVWAGDGNDTIIANDFGNTIQAGRGNDLIVAGTGMDFLYGGPGSDVFSWKMLGSTADKILDFTAGQDTIDLQQLWMSLCYTGTDPLADHWLALVSDGGGGTNVVIDPHNGQTLITLVDVTGVAPSMLHQSTSYWTLTA